ncbi:hypothetical protein HLI_21245 (plasmid) [Halobacillus litoralis]|uniref:DUF3854 domain-containing protein n=2 Tax=Halobacillus litoralis TaxID=45668 RepID=A0A410MJA5_9BACI|nr:hypothetical protein HLI_21245 [Halobacillus litoralis]
MFIMSKDMRGTKIPGWFEFYRIACPICNKSGGCMQNQEGDVVACIREVSDRPFSKNSSLPSYLHFLKGEKKRRKIDPSQAASISGEKKLDEYTLNEVYQSLLELLKLDEEHYVHLTSKKRQLSDEQIRVRDYQSFPDKPWEAVKLLQQSLGRDEFKGIPGFFEAEGKYGKYWSISGMKGILIPYRNLRKEIIGFQYRLDQPPNDVKVQERKQGLRAVVKEQPNLVQFLYEGEILFEQRLDVGETVTVYSPESSIQDTSDSILGWVTLKKGNRYYWLSSAKKNKGASSGDPAPIHVTTPTHRMTRLKTGEPLTSKKVWLTEGALKADISSDLVSMLMSKDQLAAYGDTFIALPGVNSWQMVLPILKEMGVEEINLCFDMDAVDNIYVKAILMQCIKKLKEEKYHVNMVVWNSEHSKGIDDLLLSRKLPQFKRLF